MEIAELGNGFGFSFCLFVVFWFFLVFFLELFLSKLLLERKEGKTITWKRKRIKIHHHLKKKKKTIF